MRVLSLQYCVHSLRICKRIAACPTSPQRYCMASSNHHAAVRASELLQSHPISSDLIRSHPISSDLIRASELLHAMLLVPICMHPICMHPICMHPICMHPICMHPICMHPCIRAYEILHATTSLAFTASSLAFTAFTASAFAGSRCVRRFARSGSYEEGTRLCPRRRSGMGVHRRRPLGASRERAKPRVATLQYMRSVHVHAIGPCPCDRAHAIGSMREPWQGHPKATRRSPVAHPKAIRAGHTGSRGTGSVPTIRHATCCAPRSQRRPSHRRSPQCVSQWSQPPP